MKTPMPQYIIGQQLSVQRALKYALGVLKGEKQDESIAIDDLETILEHVEFRDSLGLVEALDKYDRERYKNVRPKENEQQGSTSSS